MRTIGQVDVEPIIVNKIVGDTVNLVNKKLDSINVTYVYGKQDQIIRQLLDMDKAGRKKYPLLILYQEFPERFANYQTVSIPKIVIATISNATDYPQRRYEKNFIPVLYPIFDEFLIQIVKHKFVLFGSQDSLEYTKWDRMGGLPIHQDILDIVDAIEVNNLNLTLSKIKNC